MQEIDGKEVLPKERESLLQIHIRRLKKEMRGQSERERSVAAPGEEASTLSVGGALQSETSGLGVGGARFCEDPREALSDMNAAKRPIRLTQQRHPRPGANVRFENMFA